MGSESIRERSRRTRVGVLSCLVLVLSLAGAENLAGPATPTVFTLVQPDGTAFQARVVGDEWGDWTETIGGYTILKVEATGAWVYAVRDPSGSLVASDLVAGSGATPPAGRHLRPDTAVRGAAITGPELPGRGIAYAPPVSGTHPALVLVVDFTPSSLVGTNAALWNSRFFGASNSVDDYLDEVSYGQLGVSPAAESHGTANDGVVFVTLGYAHPNTGGTINDTNRQLVLDALIASDPSVVYSSFDTNFDGYLSTDELHVVTVIAGYETSYGGTGSACTPNVWAHRWSLDGGGGTVVAPTLDGVVVGHWWGGASGTKGGYTQVGEWHCATWDTPGHAGTIGQICHELGHDLGSGLPDLYDTDNSSEGVGEWCLQGTGAWNVTTLLGDTPAHWSAWAKSYLGLLTPTQVTTNTDDLSLPRVEDATGANHGVYQLLDNPSGVDWDWGSPGTGEYFLLENRQQIGYDAALPGNGLLIWHIYEPAPGDNSANADEGSTAPGDDATDYRVVTLEQRDGNFDLEGYGITGGVNRGDATDPWVSPHEFDDGSTPNSRLYGGTVTSVSVTDISASAATMSADIQFGPAATAAAFRVESSGDVLMDQTLHSAALATGAADVAEWVVVSESVEPGDVLELDPTRPGTYRKTRGGCSALVAGIVSTEPGVILGALTPGDRALLALIGIVPVKACDEGGPIMPGDLLVPASTPGYVRRWNPTDVGCPLVGKALAPLVDSEGLVLALLTR